MKHTDRHSFSKQSTPVRSCWRCDTRADELQRGQLYALSAQVHQITARWDSHALRPAALHASHPQTPRGLPWLLFGERRGGEKSILKAQKQNSHRSDVAPNFHAARTNSINLHKNGQSQNITAAYTQYGSHKILYKFLAL